ncbi:MAG TPA: protein GumC [Candidatus Desulfofervidus auxilii]|uniref:Protein GumC n=1 Tax=Desulfofervidus auxilii TaxID=1621989 RepID=A0A7C0Y5Y0_DESA2|nr:protein GumC [Candidatus Desulfofervidus auxilii]
MTNEAINLHDYIEIGLRRKWYFIIPFVLIMAATIFYVKTAPNIYQATTLILVESQKVPTSYVRPTVTESIQTQLRTITEQIMSRAYLEKVIKEFNLYSEIRNKFPMENIIERMRKCIKVQVKKGRAFSVSFEDKDPIIAMKVANRLASIFIEENLKVREEMAEGTLLFLEKELERVRKLLKEQEKKISEFRAKHLGVLPEQLEANLRTLDRLQLQLQNVTQSLKVAEETKRQLLQQLSQMENMGSFITIDDTEESIDASYENPTLTELKKQLAQLKLRYTDKHPEIIRLKKLIARFEKEERNKEQRGETETFPESTSPWKAQIEAQLTQLDTEIAQLKAEQKRLKAEIKKYEKRVEITPKVEQQLKELSRGYEVTQKEYQSLLDKKLQAELAANMERKQKGQTFRILDPAKVPEKPIRPNRPKLLLMGLFLGLAAGVGLVVLVEYLNQSFYKVEDLEKATGLTVIANIPEIKKKQKRLIIKRS